MKTILIWAALVLLLTACGGRSMNKTYAADAAYEPIEGAGAPPAPPEEAVATEESETAYLFDDDLAMDAGEATQESARGDVQIIHRLARSTPEPAPKQEVPTQVPVNKPRKAEKPALKPEGPMIVYNGYLHLRVRRLMDALDEISTITREHGGYVDAMTQRSIVVRIPGNNFDALLEVFAKLGDVLSREISAVEVTEQYTDLTSRLAVAEEARTRLLALLAKVTQAHERLRILEEIKRLSEEIESIKSTLSTLENLLKYFTISIDLTPILQDDASIAHQSAFTWVRELSPHRTTLHGATDAIQMKLPADFVLFSKSADYRAQAADTTIVRGGIVDNNPKGDNTFWSDAIAYEMQGRSEVLEDKGTHGNVKWLLFKNDDLQPRWYLTGVHVQGDNVYVLEVFFPNKAAFDAHYDNLLKSLETFEVMQ